MTTKTELLVWTCEACGAPIADESGYIHVNRRAIDRVGLAHNEWEKANRAAADPGKLVALGGLPALPGSAHWQAHHRACDPDPGADDYWFDVARARTHAELLTWTAHLMGKDWFEHTAWGSLIRSKAGVDA